MRTISWSALALGAVWFGAACGGSDDADEKSDDAGFGNADAGHETAKDAGKDDDAANQTPPMGADEVEAWLAEGEYLKWHCEADTHEARAPSPHGFNRICSNDLIAQNAKSSDAWPKGSAAVKELYASADDKQPVGYAVYLKTEDDSADGARWYWYERVPLDHPAPHDAKGVVADGMGNTGPAKTICVSCHAAAGSDEPHTPSVGGHDEVYTPVR